MSEKVWKEYCEECGCPLDICCGQGKVSLEWLPAILADYCDWLEGIKGSTYETRKGDEKYPPRIQTALMFLRGTGFWKELEENQGGEKRNENEV